MRREEEEEKHLEVHNGIFMVRRKLFKFRFNIFLCLGEFILEGDRGRDKEEPCLLI